MEEYKVDGLDTCDDAIKMAHLGKEQILQQGYVNLSVTNNQEYIRISIEPPQGQNRVSHDIVCVLDISGSMDSDASVKNKDGQKESQGLTSLDILKHATKTIIHNLSDQDRFALVSYSDDSRLEFDLQYMTKENIQLAEFAIENLETEGSTNIWAGIYDGMELLREKKIPGQHQSIYLLTDGEPNMHPPSGYVETLKKYTQKMHPNFYFSLNTFAFGKHIDTPLLDKYATIGNGQYCFIPCPGFIGTIFVNSIANTLNTMASQCELSFELLNGNQLIEIPGNLEVVNNKIKIGDIKFGQSREIVLKVKFAEEEQQRKAPMINVSVSYYDYVNKQKRLGEAKDNLRFEWDDPMIEVPLSRLTFNSKVREASDLNNKGKQVEAVQIIKDLSALYAQKIQQLKDREEIIQNVAEKKFELNRNIWARNFLECIKKDVDGEVFMAINQMHSFTHWGKSFLPSLCHCHVNQQCNNFCDPGIQGYGGEMFRNLKDQAEMIFMKIKPPKPSKKKQNENNQQNNPQQQPKQQKQGAQQNTMQPQQNDAQQQKPQQVKNNPPPPRQRTPSPEVDMAQYYNCGGGCFHPESSVKLKSGQHKLVKDIVKGDKLLYGTVIAVVEIDLQKRINPFCEFQGGLILTPNHPVFHNNKWVKPKEVTQIKLLSCQKVYNFVLSESHIVEINGIKCVTLGHELKDAPHPYFGTKKIVQDLRQSVQFKSGRISLLNENFVRNQENQQVCGIQF